MKQNKQKQLDKVAQDLAKSNCPLRAGAIQAVPGEGNPDADIMFIGEAPGKKEDETGKPFCGASGRILNELIISINLEREDVFVTSIEKFRPPKNRDPKPSEVEACFPYLERQIQIIDPKIIITLGRHALTLVLNWQTDEKYKTISMGDWHGKSFTGKDGRTYFSIHHPSAVLHSFKKEVIIEDLKKISKLLK